MLDADEAFGGYWAAPHRVDCLGVQDWRSLTNQGTPGTPLGHGLFAYAAPVAIAGSLYVGDDPLVAMRPADRAALAAYLGVTPSLPSGNLAELLHVLNTEHNDPTGVSRWTGRRMTRDGIGVSLPGFGELLRYAYQDTHPAWSTTVAKFRAAYQRHKARGLDLTHLQRYTGATMMTLFGSMSTANAERILPPGDEGDGYQRPTTSYGDTFVDTNGVDLTAHTPTGTDAGTSWGVTEGTGNGMEVQSNAVENLNVETTHMHLADALSNDTHDAQITIKTIVEASANQSTAAPICRMTNDTTVTNYYTRLEHAAGDTWNVETGQRVAGSKTSFGQTTNRGDPTLPAVLKLSINADASVVEAFVDAVSEHSFDDSASEVGAGNVYCGISIFPKDSASDVSIEDFSCTDNLSAGLAIPIAMYHYQQMQRV